MCLHDLRIDRADPESIALAKAIQRLEARKWCADAELVLDAARKQLGAMIRETIVAANKPTDPYWPK